MAVPKISGHFGKVCKLYHATSCSNAMSILSSRHFRPSNVGETGAGVYFAAKPEDAIKKGSRGGRLPNNYVLVCSVLLNESWELSGAFADPQLTREKVFSKSCSSVHVTNHPTGDEYMVYDDFCIKPMGCLLPTPGSKIEHEQVLHVDGREICWFDHVCMNTEPGHSVKYAHPYRELLYPVCSPTHTVEGCKVLCWFDERCTDTTPGHLAVYQHPRKDFRRGDLTSALCPYDEWCPITIPTHLTQYKHPRKDIKIREFGDHRPSA